MSDNTLVSVIVPSFNQGKYIRQTLISCLAQNYRPIEILVMDGGSCDETISILQELQAPELTWVSEPDNGVVEAVNKGLARCSGNLITIQSSDDLYLPGAISAVVEKYKDNPYAGLFYGDVELIDENSEITGADKHSHFDLSEFLGRLQYVPQPGAFFTRQAMNSINGWRHSVSYAADADYWMRIATRFPVVKLSRVLAQYRYHSEQRDQQKANILADWITAVTDLIAAGNLSSTERRYAKAGIQLAKYRYATSDAWWFRTQCLYKALMLEPSMVKHPRFPRKELFPGRVPIWSVLSSIKRKLGFKPRVT